HTYIIQSISLNILFTYTTLFRSISVLKEFNRLDVLHIDLNSMYNNNVSSDVINESIIPVIRFLLEAEFDGVVPVDMLYNLYSLRSEEHTSELQSRFDLVCRLLLE